jgi:hypothetical protein
MVTLTLLGLALLGVIGFALYLYLLHRTRRAMQAAIEDVILDAYKAGDSWRFKE